MKPKNFVRHPRGGHGKREVRQTIKDLEKQVRYLESIGDPKNQLTYFQRRLKWAKKKLSRFKE